MEDEIKLRGHRIRVCEAPEPSTIMWENFGFVRWGAVSLAGGKVYPFKPFT